MHRFGAYVVFALALAACSNTANDGTDPFLIRNPTVPIGAIQRFEPPKFDGDWQVQTSAGGDWSANTFTVSRNGQLWRDPARSATIAMRATGIMQLTYDDASQRDLWVIWTDPDHHTVALGAPEGTFGIIATRVGHFRADQVRAAEQVLDFNGYRTDTWKDVP